MDSKGKNINGAESPLLSVIIPCYNSAAFIKRAVDCVFKQTFKDWELILVNNNSTDNTQQILEQYQKQYPEKIKVLLETKNGAPAARNKGLMAAQGKWVQFLDADDEILPEKIEGQVQLAELEDATVVASPYTIRKKESNPPVEVVRELERKDYWLGLIRSTFGITSSNLWKKEALLQVGGWDESLVSSQEYDLMFRVLQVSPKVGFDNRKATIVNIEPGISVSRGGGPDKGLKILESRIGLRIRIKQFLKDKQLLTKERELFLNKFIYGQLVLNYRFNPHHVRERLEHLKLKVPLSVKLRGLYFMFKMDMKVLFRIN